jgi:hypothetical protein
MKKKNYILLSFLLIAVLIFTNPSEENHLQTVKLKLKMSMNKKMSSDINSSNNSFNSIGKGLGIILGDALIDRLTENFVFRQNFIIFSLTKVNFKGEDKIIGLGILGNVIISNKIDDFLNKRKQIE